MSVDKGVVERVQLLINRHTNGNVAQFAEKISITRSAMSKIYRGEANPSLSTLQEILKVFPSTDGGWLLVGKEYESGTTGHNIINHLNEPEKKYGNQDLIELIREQFKVKDAQITRLIEKIK